MTNNPQQIPPLKLGVEPDESSFKKVEDRTAQAVDRIKNLTTANDSVAASAQRMGRSLQDAFALGATKADENVKAIRTLRNEVKGLDDDNRKSNLKIEGLRRVGGALSQLGFGEVGGAVSRAGDIAQIGKEIKTVTGELGGFGTAMIGIGAVAVATSLAVDQMNRNLEPTAKLLTQATAQLDAYYDAIQTGTTDSITKSIGLLRGQKEFVDQELQTLKASLDNAFASEQAGFGGDAAARLKFALASTNPEFQKLGKRIEELEQQAGSLEGKIGGLNAALGSTAVAANDARAALEKQADEYGRSINEQIRLQQQGSQLIASGTKKQVDDRIKALSDEARQIRSALEFFPNALLETDRGKEIYQQLAERLKMVNGELTYLKDNVKGIVDAKDALQKLVESAKKTVERIVKEVNERNARVAEVQGKYEDDVARIEEAALQKRADIQKRYNDRLVDIARQAADAAESALRRLEEQRDDLTRGLVRDEEKAERDAAVKRLDIQIGAQREEAKAYRDHQREMEQIRKDARLREVGFLLDRNFLGLYQSRLQTAASLERASDRFSGDRQERQIGQQQQLDDLRRNLQVERNERLIAYRQQIQDAQITYARALADAQRKAVAELAIAREARDAALREVQQSTASELRIRKNAYDQALRLASQYGAAFVAAEDRMQRERLRRAESYLTSGRSGGALVTRAGGGSLAEGQMALVNDGRPGQRESFNGVLLPRGLGVFMPLQSGDVSPGRGSSPITLNVYPSPGMDEEKLAHKTLDLLEKVIGSR